MVYFLSVSYQHEKWLFIYENTIFFLKYCVAKLEYFSVTKRPGLKNFVFIYKKPFFMLVTYGQKIYHNDLYQC